MATGGHLVVSIRSQFEKNTFAIFEGICSSKSNEVSKSVSDKLYADLKPGPGLLFKGVLADNFSLFT